MRLERSLHGDGVCAMATVARCVFPVCGRSAEIPRVARGRLRRLVRLLARRTKGLTRCDAERVGPSYENWVALGAGILITGFRFPEPGIFLGMGMLGDL